mgnify:CR=1 FL=1
MKKNDTNRTFYYQVVRFDSQAQAEAWGWLFEPAGYKPMFFEGSFCWVYRTEE